MQWGDFLLEYYIEIHEKQTFNTCEIIECSLTDSWWLLSSIENSKDIKFKVISCISVFSVSD